MSSPLWFVHVVNMIIEMFMIMRVVMLMFYRGVMFMNVVMSVSVLVLVHMKVAVSVGVVAGLLSSLKRRLSEGSQSQRRPHT